MNAPRPSESPLIDAPSGPAPATRRVVDAVLEAWPMHRGFLVKSFRDRDERAAAVAEQVASLVLRLAGDTLAAHVAGYRWMCEMVDLLSWDLVRPFRVRHYAG